MISIILVGLLATNFTIKKKHLAAIFIIATPLSCNYIMLLFKYSIYGKTHRSLHSVILVLNYL